MGIIDAENQFSTGQVPTTTDQSDDSLNRLNTRGDIGVGEPVEIEFLVTAAFAGGTSLRFDIVDDNNAALSSPAVLASSPVILTAALVLGAKFRVAIPAGVNTQQYLGAQYTIVGTMSGGGALDAYISPIAQQSEDGYFGKV